MGENRFSNKKEPKEKITKSKINYRLNIGEDEQRKNLIHTNIRKIKI